MDTTGSELLPRRTRGRHHIYLGYAVGVGKTYAMLSEAQRLARHHIDVVVGFLEPHGRADIEVGASRLERLPMLQLEYHGLTSKELDVDAAIARRPCWLLVDELAHEITAGGPYEKRWQAVDAILSAGVNVISTVNVQHLESLNGFVYQVTGIRVGETVPDRVLDEADRIILVDIAPDELISRVKQGGVYSGGETGPALTHFFRRSSLEALRAAAQRVAAEHHAKAYVGQ